MKLEYSLKQGLSLEGNVRHASNSDTKKEEVNVEVRLNQQLAEGVQLYLGSTQGAQVGFQSQGNMPLGVERQYGYLLGMEWSLYKRQIFLFTQYESQFKPQETQFDGGYAGIGIRF